MKRRRDISIIIPVYNEETTIGRVIDEVLAVNFGKRKIELFVVDDGSTDKTGKILVAHPKRKKFVIIKLKKNGGKGTAVRTGISRSRARVVIIHDADFEYDPREIPKLAEPILSGKAVVVYGSRFKGRISRMTWLRRLANRLLTIYVNLIYGTKITDACTCHKTFQGDLVRGFQLKSSGFEFCHELTANVGRRGLPIKEIPITYTARTISENIKSSWVDLIKQLWLIASFRFRLWRN